MTAPAKYNFTIPRGKTFDRSFVLKADDVVVDLTGWKPRAEFRELDGQYGLTAASSLLLAVDETSGLTIPTPANGTVVLHLSAEQTLLLGPDNEPGAVAYEIELFDDSGAEVLVRGFLAGTVRVLPETARSAAP